MKCQTNYLVENISVSHAHMIELFLQLRLFWNIHDLSAPQIQLITKMFWRKVCLHFDIEWSGLIFSEL